MINDTTAPLNWKFNSKTWFLKNVFSGRTGTTKQTKQYQLWGDLGGSILHENFLHHAQNEKLAFNHQWRVSTVKLLGFLSYIVTFNGNYNNLDTQASLNDGISFAQQQNRAMQYIILEYSATHLQLNLSICCFSKDGFQR